MANNNADELELDKRSVEELRYIQQLYQNQYSMLGNSINMLIREMQDLNAAQQALEHMDLFENKKTLTELGGGFYVESSVQSTKNIIVGIGSGYLVEKELDEAKGHIANLIKSYTENFNRLTKSRKELEAAIIDMNYKIGEKSR